MVEEDDDEHNRSRLIGFQTPPIATALVDNDAIHGRHTAGLDNWSLYSVNCT